MCSDTWSVLGKKKRAAQQDIWKDLRSLAYFGICDCQRKLSNCDAAIANCQKSLTYDPDDPYVHYALGLVTRGRRRQPAASRRCPPRQHFQAMLGLNPDLTESEYARKNLAGIRKLIACP